MFVVDGLSLPSGGYRRVTAANTGGATTTIENYARAQLTIHHGRHAQWSR